MTDVPDGSGQVPRRSPRVGDGGAPVSGALAIVLAAVAVIAGWLILRSLSDDGEAVGGFDTQGVETSDGATADASTSDSVPVPTLPPTTTTPTLVTTGATVIVANANSTGGSAGAMTRELQTAGFTTVDPVDASAAVGDQDTSTIYFDATVPAAQQVADSLATVLGGDVPVQAVPDPVPTADGALNGANVLLLLGNDKAGKTVAELSPGAATGTGPVTITNPPVGSGTTAPSG